MRALSFGIVSHLLPRASGFTRFLGRLCAQGWRLLGVAQRKMRHANNVMSDHTRQPQHNSIYRLVRSPLADAASRDYFEGQASRRVVKCVQIESWHAISCTTIGTPS